MGNFSIKEDLLKLKGSFITNFKGRTETKRCLVIPVDDSGLYVGEKGVYLNLTAIEMENPQFKETHCIKQSLDKEIYEALSEEQRQALPIIGGMKPLVKKAAPQMNVGSTSRLMWKIRMTCHSDEMRINTDKGEQSPFCFPCL